VDKYLEMLTPEEKIAHRKASRTKYNRKTRKYRKEHGLCSHCGIPLESGFSYCEVHKKINVAKQLKRKSTFAKDKRCSGCGRKLDPEIDEGYLSCLICRDRRRS
jgi:ribosomal protein S14